MEHFATMGKILEVTVNYGALMEVGIIRQGGWIALQGVHCRFSAHVHVPSRMHRSVEQKPRSCIVGDYVYG